MLASQLQSCQSWVILLIHSQILFPEYWQDLSAVVIYPMRHPLMNAELRKNEVECILGQVSRNSVMVNPCRAGPKAAEDSP